MRPFALTRRYTLLTCPKEIVPQFLFFFWAA